MVLQIKNIYTKHSGQCDENTAMYLQFRSFVTVVLQIKHKHAINQTSTTIRTFTHALSLSFEGLTGPED